MFIPSFSRYRTWVHFIHRIGNKILPAGENLPDRAYHAIDMFNAVYDSVGIIHKNNITVLSHKFYHEAALYLIPQFIQVLQSDLYYPFKANLPDPCHSGAAQMFS